MPAHNVARANDFMGLPATLRNFPTFVTGAPDAICGAASLTPAGPFRFARRRGRKTKPISPSETKRFAGHAVSHWNPYERRIRHFAELCVFNSLAPFSFRRFRGLFVFNGLARLVVSPESFPSAFDSGSHRAAAAGKREKACR